MRDFFAMVRRLVPGALDPDVVFMVPPSRIVQPPWYTPRILDEESMTQLTEEILSRGKGGFPTLPVRRLPQERFELLAGQRPLEAARRIGYAAVPVRVVDVDDATAMAITLSDALTRERLSPWEQAQGLAELVETLREMGREPQSDMLARLMGHTAEWVRSRLRIADRLTPAVLTEAGIAVHDMNVLPESDVLAAAEESTVSARAARLREAHGNRAKPRD